jgi:phosphate uptake regulator
MIEQVGRLEDELGSLAEETTELGLFAEDTFKNATAALYEQPTAAAHIVLDTERVSVRVYLSLNQKALAIVGWYRPLGDDLRRVVELQQIAAELARIAEDSRHIAEHALALDGTSEMELSRAHPKAADLLLRMVRQTFVEVRGCIILTTTRDKTLARRLLREDSALDVLFAAFRRVLDEAVRANPRGAAPLQRLLLVGVYLEDIGNRVAAICRTILYEPPRAW